MAKAWRRPPLPQFTAKNLYEAFAPYSHHMRRPFTARMAETIANMRQDSHKAIDRIMNTVNKAIEGHGVEAIVSQKAATYGDIVALFVNVGDQYAATVIYDVRRGQLYVTDWDEWMGRNEKLFR